jgi:thiol-disulfide isomerase/thioredoxin
MRVLYSLALVACSNALAQSAPVERLRFVPDAPRPGNSIAVSYRPAKPTTGDALALRARIRTIHGNPYSEPPNTEGTTVVTVATLHRASNGTYTGSFIFPDSALFMSLAVESTGASWVDSNQGRYWELMAHEPDGRPVLAALRQRTMEWMGLSWEEVSSTNRRIAALYPERPEALTVSWSGDLERAGDNRADSVRDVYIAKLADRFAAAAKDPDRLRRELPVLAGLAHTVMHSVKSAADSAKLLPWIDRAIAEQPTAPEVIDIQWSRIYPLGPRNDLRASLAAFEALWQRSGDSLYRASSQQPRHQFSRGGWRLAILAHDTAAYLRWHERVAAGGRYAKRRSALSLVDVPGTRREGMQWLREELRAIDSMKPEYRFLGETNEHYRTRSGDEKRLLMAALGKALIADGARVAGLDSLTRAAATGWDAEAFQLIADGRLAAGDTIGALRMQALLAADPRTTESARSMAAQLAGQSIGVERWQTLLAEGRAELTRRVESRLVREPSSVPLRFADAKGQFHSLAELTGGRPTFIHFWTKDCGDAMRDLAKADSVAAFAARLGLRVLSVTIDDPSPEVDQIIRRNRLGTPVYYDRERTINRGLNSWSYPSYLLVDGKGTLRLRLGSEPDVVLPYAAVLAATEMDARSRGKIR